MTSRFDTVSANGIEASRSRYPDSVAAFCTSITPPEWWSGYWLRGELSADECHEIQAPVQTHYSLVAQQECPVCGSPGSLRGDIVGSAGIAAEVFACATCGLALRGPGVISVARLPKSFSTTRTLTAGD
jgi:ribosomal protein L37AE/L43A